MSVAIKIESLSKLYRLGELGRSAFISEWVARLTGRPRPGKKFWALKDVSVEIKQGEVVGVLGRNGAGKSTLLKIISQIMAPTSGRICMKGRVASLLEVGTGFHQELTGRENVFLNGAILGMSRREITSKFDAIAEFSGVEEFLDTPVKRYSSGMRVRLAFAVAAHLNAEIMIIDEVLAVGDAAFQQKCLGKIGEVASAGRTVLFVSHHAAAIANLCKRGLVMQKGQLIFDGTQTEALQFYHQTVSTDDHALQDRQDRTGTGEVRIGRIEFRDTSGGKLNTVESGQDVDVYLFFENHSLRAGSPLSVRLNVSTPHGVPVFTHGNKLVKAEFGELPKHGAFVCRLPKLPLPSATYHLEYRVSSDFRSSDVMDSLTNAATLRVEGGDYFGSGMVPTVRGGITLVNADWRMEEEKEKG